MPTVSMTAAHYPRARHSPEPRACWPLYRITQVWRLTAGRGGHLALHRRRRRRHRPPSRWHRSLRVLLQSGLNHGRHWSRWHPANHSKLHGQDCATACVNTQRLAARLHLQDLDSSPCGVFWALPCFHEPGRCCTGVTHRCASGTGRVIQQHSDTVAVYRDRCSTIICYQNKIH